MSQIAIVTCRVLPEPDTDQQPLLSACKAAGLSVQMVPWDDVSVDWGSFSFAVLRSCWNYYEQPDRFREWILTTATQTTLVNSAETLLWNLDKGYLLELQDQGIAIVPTRIIHESSALPQAVIDAGWERFVVKPAISAASYLTRTYTSDELLEAKAFVVKILESRSAMVQPFIASVASGGEVSLIHIQGELTHAITKSPRFDGGEEDVSSAFQPDDALKSAAAKVLATVQHPWLYARVDLMKGDDGSWLLSELELLEPSLFLSQHPPALAKFVEVLEAQLVLTSTMRV